MNEYIVPIVQDIEFGNFSVIGECVQYRLGKTFSMNYHKLTVVK